MNLKTFFARARIRNRLILSRCKRALSGETHTSVTISILPDVSGDYVLTGGDDDAVLRGVKEYLMATKEGSS